MFPRRLRARCLSRQGVKPHRGFNGRQLYEHRPPGRNCGKTQFRNPPPCSTSRRIRGDCASHVLLHAASDVGRARRCRGARARWVHLKYQQRRNADRSRVARHSDAAKHIGRIRVRLGRRRHIDRCSAEAAQRRDSSATHDRIGGMRLGRGRMRPAPRLQDSRSEAPGESSSDPSGAIQEASLSCGWAIRLRVGDGGSHVSTWFGSVRACGRDRPFVARMADNSAVRTRVRSGAIPHDGPTVRLPRCGPLGLQPSSASYKH